MKTRYTQLVKIKKDAMEKRERDLQLANTSLRNAEKALGEALSLLSATPTPQTGTMQEYRMAQTLIASQRTIVEQRREWVAFAEQAVRDAQNAFKAAMVEYEKFNYLETEQVKKILKEQNRKEQLMMDELAGFTFMQKGVQG